MTGPEQDSPYPQAWNDWNRRPTDETPEPSKGPIEGLKSGMANYGHADYAEDQYPSDWIRRP